MARKTSVRFGWQRYPASTYAILGLLLLINAFLMSVAIASPNYPWLSFTTLIPLFVAIRLLTPSQAAGAGALWGLSLAFFSSLFPDSPLTLSVFSALVLGTVPAGYAYAAAHLTRRFGFNPLILSFGWIVVELALTPIGLTTGLLAGSQHDNPLMASIGQSLGYLLIGYLVALANAVILAIVADLDIRVPAASPRHPAIQERGCALAISNPVLRSFHLLYPLQPRAPPCVI